MSSIALFFLIIFLISLGLPISLFLLKRSAKHLKPFYLLPLLLLSGLILARFTAVNAYMGATLTLSKDFGGSTSLEAESGDEFAYFIAYRCASITLDCFNTVLTDVLPPEVIYVDAIGPASDVDSINYDLGSHTVTVNFVEPLSAGSTGIIEITVKFPPGTLPGTTAVNQATSLTDGGAESSNTATATATGAYEMFVNKSIAGDNDDMVIGSDFTTNYTLDVCNPDDLGGVRLTNPTIVDQLPPEATFVSASNGGVYDPVGHTITWTSVNSGGTLPDPVPVVDGCPISLNVEIRLDPNGPDGTPANADDPVAGNTATNTMTLTGSPEDGTPDVNLIGPANATILDPYFDNTPEKTSTSPSSYINRSTEELVDGTIIYTLSYENTGTITATNVTITDALPIEVIVTSIDISPVIDPADGFYRTVNNPTVWVPFPENSYSAATTVVVTTTTTADPTDIELTPGDAIAGIQWNLGTIPYLLPAWEAQINTVINTAVTPPTSFDNCITTTANYTDSGGSSTSTNNLCEIANAIEPRAIPRINKTSDIGNLLPGETTLFTLEAYNSPIAHNNVVAPITLADLLPERFEVVVADNSEPTGYRPPTPLEISNGDWYTFSATDAAPAPTHIYTPTFNAENETLLRWDFPAPYEQAPGETITVTFYARVADFTTPQQLENNAIILNDPSTVNALPCDASDGNASYTDTEDIDGDGNTTETGCQIITPVQVESFLAMNSQKFVQGNEQTGWKDYDTTVTGGDVDYHLTITNTSNVTATNIVIYDIFPYIGDTGVIDTSSRGSEWAPYLIAPITDTMGLPMVIAYSQSTNPCRPELLSEGPTGCTNDWSTIPPNDITTVRAVRFDMCNGTCLELAPDDGFGGGSFEFSWNMVAPNSAQVGDVAWNSFGFYAEGGGLKLLPSEPIRVGIEVITNTLPTVSIGDYVWLDVYGQQDDGIQQPEEEGLRGVRVELRNAITDALVDFRTTGPDANGNPGYYEFIDIPPGDYYIRFFQPQDGRFYTFSPGEQGGDTAVDSNGVLLGNDATFGDYIQTNDFTVVATDDYSFDQGMWVEADYGDAPASYPVEASSQGNPADAGRHVIVDGIYLGSGVDGETDGQPSIDALGDDATDDEDGVTFAQYIGTAGSPSAIMTIGESSDITISPVINSPFTTTTTAYLNAWIDFNADGDWDDPGEQIATDLVVNDGVVDDITVAVPGTAVAGTTYARFRLSTVAGLDPTGTAPNGEVEDYQIQLLNPPEKSVVATSEAHTGGTNLTIGEIVRYHLRIPVPEGDSTTFTVQDNLPNGLQFLDDGTATASFTATTTITWTQFTITGTGAFDNGRDPFFNLGTVTNNDNDSGLEYVAIEFNALVLNDAANNAGTTLDNTATVSYNNFTDSSQPVQITVVEPDIDLIKTTSTVPNDAGDQVVYQLTTINNSGANIESGYELVISDTLDSNLNLQAIQISAPGYVVITDSSSIPASQLIIAANRLDPGDSITVVLTATVANTVQAGQTITNTGYLQYTSLPNLGTASNPTGSTTPGGSGADDGERDGSGGKNDYAEDSASIITFVIDEPVIDKQVSPTNYTIGETVIFNLLVTLPEGDTIDLDVVDDLPAGLSYVSHQIIETAASSNGFLALDYNGTLPAPVVTAPGGSGVDASFDFGTVTTAGDNIGNNNSFLIEITAVVLNEIGNQAGDTLTNTATINYRKDGEPASLNDSVDINLIEPVLTIDKQNTVPAAIEAGSVITYQLVLQHNGTTTADAFDVVITDTLPSQLTNITVQPIEAQGIAAPVHDLSGNTLTIPNSGSFDFPQGAVITVTLTAEVDLTAVPGQTVTNTAGATWSSLDGTPAEERDGGGAPDNNNLLDSGALDDYEVTDSASFQVDPADLTKVIVSTSAPHTSGSNVTIGEIITYSLSVTLPESTIPSLQVIDNLPAGLAFITGTVTLDTTNFNGTLPAYTVTNSGGSGDDLTIDFGSFVVPNDGNPANNLFVVDYQVVVLDEAGNVGLNPPGQTTLSNDAAIQIGSQPPVSSTPVNVTVVEPQLEIAKTFNTDTAAPNDTITVTLVVTNTGTSDAFDVIVDDPLDNAEFTAVTEGTTPAGFTFSTVPSGGDTIVRYTGGTIPAGSSVTLTFQADLASALLPSPPDINNVATVTQATTLDSTANDGDDAQERDEPDVNDSDTLTVLVPDLVLTKDDGQTYISANEQVTYTLTISNVGGITATGVVITETVPANSTFAGTAGWVCTPDNSAGSTCTYAYGSLANGASDTVIYSIIADSAIPSLTASIVNTAVIADDHTQGNDPTPANNTDSDTDTVTATIGNFIWNDLNGNGIQDGGETGISGVTVVLLDATSTAVFTTTTNASGTYSFTQLIPADYSIRVTPPVGYIISPQDQGGDTADSDINPATGETVQTTLSAGEIDFTWDAGLYQSATIGDYVWYDIDNDGIQDGGAEVGLFNVTVDLYDSGDNFITTTTTNASGYYSFTNLVPGDYYIDVTPPAGYTNSPQDQGGDDALDSDIDGSGETAVTSLSSGENDPTWDAGLYAPPASIGNFVWLDANQDGIQDANEQGVPNVTVDLYDSAGNPISTTTTSVNGLYSFINLPPGDYYIDVTPPVSYTITLQDQGGDDALDSDINPATGETIATTLDPNEDDPTWDAGLYTPPASISNLVWLDANQDGIQDAGEYGIPNVTVTLYDSNDNLVLTTTTDATGNYSFINLPPGDYYLDFTTPAGYSTVPQDAGGDDALDSDINIGTGQTISTTLTAGEDDTSWDAGFYIPPASIGNYVWLDANQDGIQGGNEQGIGGVTVELYDSGNNLIGTTTTDGNGAYGFTNLPPGDYYVNVTPPVGAIITAQDQGGDDALDSDIDAVTGETAVTTLISGENDPTWDGGLYIPPASLGDYVWLDANQDGIQDPNEYGIGGVTVDLYDDNNLFITTTTTSATGYYSFTNLAPGDYHIDVTPPLSYTITLQDQGGDDTADSDINPATGETINTTLIAGENDPTWDAGLYIPPASIGDYVWLDANQDGVQDANEYGVGGVTVELYDSNNNLIGTTSTDGNGGYSFTNLPPNDYYVVVTPPAGYTITSQDSGADDTVDSDIDLVTGETAVTTLTSGENDPTWDAGLYTPPASIGDYVWLDANQDGIQDANEFGIENVTVNLYDTNNTLIGTTTTDILGNYSFTNLPPADYYIEVVEPAGYTVTGQDLGGDDTADSDIDIVLGQTISTTLTSGENDPTWDGGLYTIPASLGDYIWLDANQDGIQDANELGIPNVTVDLYDDSGVLLDTTTTDANGYYQFDNLPPNDYYIDVTTPAGYTTVPQDAGGDDTLDSDINIGTGETISTTLVSGENDTTWDAGFYILPASLGDYVWLDADQNGVQDGDESGVAGVVVNLYDSADNLIDTTTTDGTGLYSFINLPPGDYYVEVELPLNHIFTDQDQGADDTADSDVDTTSGQTILTTLVAGENDPTWDAGVIPSVARLGDFVWEDLNQDGIQDIGEPGVAGVTVVLYDLTNTPILTTTTDANGFYEFDRLGPGDYHVEFTLPAGYDFTSQDQGGDDTADSDADPTTGATIPTTLTTGENDVSWDAGLIRPLSPVLAHIGNYVWEDLDSNGIQGVGEPGIAGITVTLYLSGTGVLSTTTTDANGLYEFINLTPADYFVEFTLPGGYTFTSQDQGADDAIDSDADTVSGQTIPTTLVAGENDTTWDAGVVQTLNPALAAIGNYVWYDSDRNGIQDIGETGVVSVTVNLYDSNGVLTGTTQTDANGLYQFIDLQPGDYHVGFVPPVGYVISDIDQGGDDGLDSDADPSPFSPTYGQTIPTTLVAGENDPSWDAGIYLPSAPTTASLGDFVWEDVNADGIQDIGETGIMSVTVNLYNSVGTLIDTTLTDPTGYYTFTNLLPGDYSVEFIPPAGYALTYADTSGNDMDDSDANPATGRTITTTLSAGENDPSWDAGIYQAVRLGNRIWNDENNDGIYDSATEVSVPDVLLELLDASGNPILSPATGLPITTTTTVSGTYAFEGIPEGTYIVRVAESNFSDWDGPLYGFVSSLNEQAVDPALDPDVDDGDLDDNGRNNPDPSNGGIESFPVTVTLGGEPSTDIADEDGAYDDDDSNLTVDFGFFELLTLGNLVWLDYNEDGVIDVGEPGVPNVLVNLLDQNGDPVLHPVSGLPLTTLTNPDGFYQFTDLYPGDYVIEIDATNFQAGGPLEGYWSSNGSSDPDNDNDVDDNGLDDIEPFNYGIRTLPVRLDHNSEPAGGSDSDDNDNTNLTVDMGFVATPTAVSLTSFTATQLDGAVLIEWSTASEVNSFGFRIYRGTVDEFDLATEIHFEPTAVSGGSGPGADYSFIDNEPPAGTLFYWLVSVETNGTTEIYAPINTTVSQGVQLFLPVVKRP